MRKRKFGWLLNINTLLVAASLAVTLFFVITGSYIQEGYNINIGAVADRRFKATRLVENRVATERLREEAEASVTPRFMQLSEVDAKINTHLNGFFDDIESLRRAYTPIFIPEAGTEGTGGPVSEADLADTLDGGIGDVVPVSGDMVVLAEDMDMPPDSLIEPSPSPASTTAPPVTTSGLIDELSEEQMDMLLDMPTVEFNSFEDNVYRILDDALESGVREDSLAKTLVDIKGEFEKLYGNDQDGYSQLGYEIAAYFLEPNLVIDEEATQRLREERVAEVQSIYYLKGQNIIDEGEIVTEEIFYVLDDLGFVAKDYMENLLPIMGAIFIVLCVFGFSLFYIFNFNKALYQNRKESLLLFTLYILVIVITKIIVRIPFVFVPVLAFTMLVGILLEYRLALVLNLSATIISMLIYKGELEFMLYFAIVGTIMALVVRFVNQRNNVFIVSLVISVVSALVACSLGILLERVFSSDIITTLLYAFLNGFFTVILCMGSLIFWESVFGVVTAVKLLDLVNPNNNLLRRMAIEAPGTYHHSLIVANLAETAAYDIGGDPNIARVGGYFHDIGKLKYPQYFSENQVGENPHDDMDPYSSVEVITSHVAYGLTLANENKLPQVIKDIIAQHHGNTLVKYFYHKAKKEGEEGAEIREEDFRYAFEIPQSKEAAIVMLADTVEAAVRSMVSNSKTMDEVDNFVRTLIKDKLDDRQLINSGFTIKDIDTVAESFMRVFKGMYHERIPYPKESKPAVAEG